MTSSTVHVLLHHKYELWHNPYFLPGKTTHLVFIKNWAAPIVSGVPVIVTFLSGEPSSALEIFIVAPDACLSLK